MQTQIQMWEQKGSWISGAQTNKLVWRMQAGAGAGCALCCCYPMNSAKFCNVRCNKLMSTAARPCSTSACSLVLSWHWMHDLVAGTGIVSHSHGCCHCPDTELHQAGAFPNLNLQLGEAAELELNSRVINSLLHALSTKLPTPSSQLLWSACTSFFWCLEMKWHL